MLDDDNPPYAPSVVWGKIIARAEFAHKYPHLNVGQTIKQPTSLEPDRNKAMGERNSAS